MLVSTRNRYFFGEEEREPPAEVSEAPVADVEQAARLREAEQLVQEERYEEAIALFEQSGQRDRTSWACDQYAQFLAEQGRFPDAYEQMRRALLGRRG